MKRKSIYISNETFQDLNRYRKEKRLTWDSLVRQRKDAFLIEKRVSENFSSSLRSFKRGLKTSVGSEFLEGKRKLTLFCVNPETKRQLTRLARSLHKSPSEIIDELVARFVETRRLASSLRKTPDEVLDELVAEKFQEED